MTDTQRTNSVHPGRTLHRSRDERIVAGVSGGLGEHLGINAWWFRWAFILLTFFGGVGFLLYLIAWLAIPGPDEDDPIVTGWVKKLDLSDGGTIFGVILVGLAVVILVSRVIDVSGTLILAAVLFLFGMLLYRGDIKVPNGTKPSEAASGPDSSFVSDESAGSSAVNPPHDAESGGAVPPEPSPPMVIPQPPRPPRERSMLGRLTLAVGLIVVASMALVDLATDRVDIDPVHYLATSVAIIGAGLLVGAFIGKARWLAIVGLLVIPALWVSTLIPTSWTFSAGEFHYQPIAAQEVQSSYDQGVGQLTIDLTDLTATEIAEVGMINASLGLGEMIIRLPVDLGVELTAKVGAGEISGPFRTIDGIGLNISREFGNQPTVLVLNLEVGAGVITITGPRSFSLNDASVLQGSHS